MRSVNVTLLHQQTVCEFTGGALMLALSLLVVLEEKDHHGCLGLL